jgi:hypothetical protein
MPKDLTFTLIPPGTNVHVLHDNSVVTGEVDCVKVIGTPGSWEKTNWKIVYSVGNIGPGSVDFAPHRVAETKAQLLAQL